MRSDTLSCADLTDTIEKALSALRANFRTTASGDTGWYHYLDDPNPGVTASAVGLYCFRLAGVTFERTSDVLSWLISQQVSGNEKTDGGWSVRTTHGFPIVEATAWVLRALSSPVAGLINAGDAIRRGAQYLQQNQNTDFGWGSYLGQPSRVFHTALAMLALQECGGDSSTIENGQKWLVNTQAQDQPAWGEMPGSEPTMLHTSFALLALLNLRGGLGANSIQSTVEWLLKRLEAGTHVERETTVEEFDVPYPYGGSTPIFQNSLPHFAGPVAVTAVLNGGADPLQLKLFAVVNEIMKSQTRDGPCTGTWELPRSPTRPSIWAIWPFVAALERARAAIFPSPTSQATVLFDSCAIIQPAGERKVTRGLLLRNALMDWLRRHKVAVGLAGVASAAIGAALLLLIAGELARGEFITVLVIPALLLIFQLIWGVRSMRRKAGPG